MRLAFFPLAFIAGALASRFFLGHVPARLAIDLAQPLPVVTWWGNNALPFLAALALTLALAFIAYAYTRRSSLPPLSHTLVASACASIAGLFWMPVFSSDVYAYAAYGEMARLGLNPYLHASTLGADPLIAAARWQWSGALPACVYGPVFVGIADALVTIVRPLGTFAQIEGFRVFACAAFVVCAALLARCGNDGEGTRGRRAALVFALNPVLLWTAIEGHNDFAMLAVVLAGIVLWHRNAFAGAFLASVAGAIKAPAILAGPALALGAGNERRVRTLAGGACGVLVAALCALPLIQGIRADPAPHGQYAPLASVQSLHPLVAIAAAALVLLALRKATTSVDRLLVIALAAWLAIPNPYPWYAAWIVPLAAWAHDKAIARTALLVTAAALLRYIPDAVAVPAQPLTLVLGLVALAAYTPLFARGIIGRS